MSRLFLAIIVSLSAGLLGSIFTAQSIPTWYVFLNKPALTPPNWVFGPVWTILYIMMGIALYLVWKKGIKKKNKVAVEVFFLQLVLNLLWSVVFFGLRMIDGGFGVIVGLWLVLALTIYEFNKISRPAALLLVPYLLWISFATYLNFNIGCLNS